MLTVIYCFVIILLGLDEIVPPSEGILISNYLFCEEGALIVKEIPPLVETAILTSYLDFIYIKRNQQSSLV